MRKSYIEEPSGESRGGGSRGSISSDLSYKLWPERKEREDVKREKREGRQRTSKREFSYYRKMGFYAEASQSHTGES